MLDRLETPPNCSACGRPAYVWRPRVKLQSGDVLHSRCYHLQVGTDWVKLDGSKMTDAEVEAHRAWTEERYPEASI